MSSMAIPFTFGLTKKKIVLLLMNERRCSEWIQVRELAFIAGQHDRYYFRGGYC